MRKIHYNIFITNMKKIFLLILLILPILFLLKTGYLLAICYDKEYELDDKAYLPKLVSLEDLFIRYLLDDVGSYSLVYKDEEARNAQREDEWETHDFKESIGQFINYPSDQLVVILCDSIDGVNCKPYFESNIKYNNGMPIYIESENKVCNRKNQYDIFIDTLNGVMSVNGLKNGKNISVKKEFRIEEIEEVPDKCICENKKINKDEQNRIIEEFITRKEYDLLFVETVRKTYIYKGTSVLIEEEEVLRKMFSFWGRREYSYNSKIETTYSDKKIKGKITKDTQGNFLHFWRIKNDTLIIGIPSKILNLKEDDERCNEGIILRGH
jgi:hypothetical protein